MITEYLNHTRCVMKKLARTISCLLAAIMLMGTMMVSVAAEGEELGGSDTTGSDSSAEEGYEAEYSYVLNYNGKKRYLSVYQPSALWYTKNPAGTRTGWIFGLYDTVHSTPENPIYINAYCMDVNTGAEAGKNYRRINLENSNYSESSAGLLRSILLNSFPHKTVEEVASEAHIEGLTVCEAIMATQLAVWETVHNELFTVTDFMTRHVETFDVWSDDVIAEFDVCNAEVLSGYATDSANEKTIESHIERLYNYLLNLAPTAPVSANIAVSNKSFTSWELPVITQNNDGTYNVTVTATVDVSMTGTDELTLSAVLSDNTYVSEKLVNGTNTVTLDFENVADSNVAYSDVKLAIDGMQTVSDVFLFDAEGDRGTSQTMVGITDNQLPVHAEVIAEQERVIRFIKHGRMEIGKDENNQPIYTSLPLSGITFDLYLAVEEQEYITEYLNGDKTLPAPETYCGLGDGGTNYPDFTVVTDANGEAAISLTKNNLPDGVYVVSERKHDAIEAPIAPFYIEMPRTNATGDGWVYDVTVQPKNMVKQGPAIRKDVLEIEHEDKSGEEEQKASVAAGEAFRWIIRGDIPVDMADAKKYVITDELDYRLTFVDEEEDVTDDVVVKVEPKSDSANYSADGENVLVKDTDYMLTVIPGTVNIDANGHIVIDGSGTSKAIQTMEVDLTAAGMEKVAKIAGAEYENYEVRVYFSTMIDEGAAIGEEIPNDAELVYISSVGFRYDAESDDPAVYTCGITINKYDAKNHANMLAGAKFILARTVTQAEVEAGESYDGALVTENGTVFVDYVDFYSTADMSGNKVSEVETNEGGIAYMYGLEAGEYHLIETKAPSDYNLLRKPITVTLNAENRLAVEGIANSNAFVLPETGGIGTLIFKICGGVLIVAAVVILILKKRREKGDEEE